MKVIALFFLAILAVLFLTAFAPLLQTTGEVSAELAFILTAILIPALIQALKFIAARFRVIWTSQVVMLICFTIAVIIAVVWLKPAFPSLPAFSEDPQVFTTYVFDFVMAVIGVGSSVFGFATIIYQVILKPVFTALGLGNDKVRQLAG